MNPKIAEEHAVRPYMAAQSRISEFAKSHGLKRMYASQVWGTVYLSEGSEFGSQLQKRHLCSLRRILGVKNSTTNWAVLRECGQEPLQFFRFHQVQASEKT